MGEGEIKMIPLNIGATADHATSEEADKLAILDKETKIILLSIIKMQLTKRRLLHELDINPGSTGKQTQLQTLYADINRYHNKILIKRKKIARIVQGIKWRGERKKRGITPPGPL